MHVVSAYEHEKKVNFLMKLDIIASTTTNQSFYTQSILMFTFHMSHVSVGIAQYGQDA